MINQANPTPKIIDINGKIKIANDLPFTLIAGPCQMESRDHALMMAEALKNIAIKLDIPLVYKSSFDKVPVEAWVPINEGEPSSLAKLV